MPTSDVARLRSPVNTASAAMRTSTHPISTGTHRGNGACSGSRSCSGFGSVIAFGPRVLVDLGDTVVGHERVVIVVEALVRRLALLEQIERALLVIGGHVHADLAHRAEV